MSVDNFQGYAVGLDDPGIKAFAITPHATNPLPFATRGLYVGGAGNVAGYLVGDSSTSVTFVNLLAGVVYPFRFARILASGTTATDLVGII